MASSGQASRILVVDDEESIRDLLESILTSEGYDVTLASSGEQAIDLLDADNFDLIITDCKMPGVGGLAVLAAAKRIDPFLPVILISGHPTSEDSARLIDHPRMVYIQKPFGVGLIQRTVAQLLEVTL